MKTSAIFSTDRCYRYELRWEWDARKPPFVVIMCNPSIADRYRLDPTCRGVMKRAAHSGYGSMIVLNVGAGINTRPSRWLTMRDPVGPKNYATIKRVLRETAKRRGVVVAGWGANPEDWMISAVLDIANDEGVSLFCFERTKSGAPKHPLYVRHDKELELWRGSGLSRKELESVWKQDRSSRAKRSTTRRRSNSRRVVC